MGLLGIAAAGAVQGAGEGIAAQGQAWTKEQIEAEKQKVEIAARENILRLSARYAQETHAANARTDLEQLPQKTRILTDEAIRKERQSPKVVAEGSTLRTPGEADFTPPKTEAPKPQELLDYYAANAKRLNSESRAIDDGMKYRDKGRTEKPLLPKYKTEKDADGNPYIVEETTGAIGRISPGDPAQSEKNPWFGAKTPAKPAGAPKIEWTMPDGSPLPGGPSSLFPGAPGGGGAPRSPSTGRPQSLSPGAVDQGYRFKGGNPRDPKNWEPVGKGQPTQAAAAQPAGRPGYASALDEANPRPKGLLNQAQLTPDDEMRVP